MTMSGTVSGIGYGELTQVVTGAGAVKRTIDQLTTQTASGFVATDYAGLGQNASAARSNPSPAISRRRPPR
jgi:hypothetical protein